MKKCNRCERVQPSERFSKNNKKSDGLQAWCKDYQRETRAQWSRDNVERTAELRLWSMYRLTPKNLADILEKQGGLCALGQHPLVNPHIDHDHKCCPGSKRTCGKCIRGIVCQSCNVMIGWFEKFNTDSELVRNITAYLDN